MLTTLEQELKDRLVRIESRMVQLGDYVGANLRTKQRINIVQSASGVAIEIDAMDVSMSRIYAELAHTTWANGPPTQPIPVYHKGRMALMIYPERVPAGGI